MIYLIVAMDPNRVIGKDNTLPWHLPEDLKHFKATTLGHPIVMGKNTWNSLPIQPLPKRTNIVITRNPIEGVQCFDNVDQALFYAQTLSDKVFVIGGQSIYEQTLNKADRLLITHVTKSYDGDCFFPDFYDRWLPSSVETHDNFLIVEYRPR